MEKKMGKGSITTPMEINIVENGNLIKK